MAIVVAGVIVLGRRLLDSNANHDGACGGGARQRNDVSGTRKSTGDSFGDRLARCEGRLSDLWFVFHVSGWVSAGV